MEIENKAVRLFEGRTVPAEGIALQRPRGENILGLCRGEDEQQYGCSTVIRRDW